MGHHRGYEIRAVVTAQRLTSEDRVLRRNGVSQLICDRNMEKRIADGDDCHAAVGRDRQIAKKQGHADQHDDAQRQDSEKRDVRSLQSEPYVAEIPSSQVEE